jgi:hypothetical protein
MTESKWLTGTDGDAMLEFVADRLSPRQWMLLSAAYARRLWDLLPDGPLRQAVEAVERAEQPLSEAERAEWLLKVDAAVPAALGAAEMAQREIVKPADPDAADVDTPILSRPNQVAPAFPLFSAASRQARNAITGIANAMTEAVQAVRVLFSEPSEQMLGLVRNQVERAADTRTQANLAANLALRLKHEGDEHADRTAAAKNKHLERARAEETVRRIEESAGARQDDDYGDDRRERASRKQLARLLREVVGNPFTPPRFEPTWRTTTVVELARGIFADRAFDRMPILGDALLDADCDEEAVLRHCRGTELGVKEQSQHVRGCWVIELILGRWQPLPPLAPGSKPRPPRTRYDDLDIGLPFDTGDTGFA